MITSNKFSQRLKELRLKKGLTQTELGEKVGVKQSTFTNWENGKREPSYENLVKLADLLEVSLDSLFGREQMKVKKRSPAQLLDNEKNIEKK